MLWRDRRESTNVEDRRGQGGGFGGGGGFRVPIGMGSRRGGGIGIGALLVILVLSWILGINPLTLLDGSGTMPFPSDVSESTEQGVNGGAPAQDEMSRFVRVVLADTEDTWTDIFSRSGETYPDPILVLFSGGARSACGFASAASGPFYCPGDHKLYIDLAFYDELRQRFKAPGDFAQAYVIAHEVGHHVQNLIGVLPKFNQMRQSMGEAQANEMSMRVELQADCFAGIWGHFTDQKGLLDAGDLEEALNAAQQIGDDTLQRRTQGYVVPESFNHGTSEQRVTWFNRGFQSGKLADCDTFNNKI
jgi:predicted metalloprotease